MMKREDLKEAGNIYQDIEVANKALSALKRLSEQSQNISIHTIPAQHIDVECALLYPILEIHIKKLTDRLEQLELGEG